MAQLRFKGRAFVENLHLGVPYHELKAVKSRGLSTKPSIHDNLIIEGDNLAALKALLPFYHGKVKCIYIDPPYNTGNEDWAYNDRVNSPMMKEWLGRTVDREDLTRHDKWCCMMLPRLKLLRDLLRDDGAIFVSIDDNEVHRLRLLMDDVFGEDNFVATVIWEKVYSPKSSAKYFSENHDYVLCYAKGKDNFQRALLPRTPEADARYTNPDDDPRGPWKPSDLSARNPYRQGTYSIECPGGRVIDGPPPGNYWRYSEPNFLRLDADNRIWWGEDKNQTPAIKRFLSEVRTGIVPETIWTYNEVGHTQKAKKTLLEIFPTDFPDFTTVKPCELIERIVGLSADEHSIILDSFAGSGTTAHAVLALNRRDGGNRRFILVECEDYVNTLTAERVRRVVKGVPKTKDEHLKDGLGGTFSYFQLGEPMQKEAMLHPSKLPSYERLAAYVFFTATGENFDPEAMRRERWFIGRTPTHDVFLIYTDDFEALKDLALTQDIARSLSRSKRPKFVFAPTKYLEEETMLSLRISFHQLPYEIYETVDRLSP